MLRGSRVAVLVHGCFWHSCREHMHLPEANRDWWALKLTSVVERDRHRLLELREAGWWPEVVWEHEDMAVAAARVARLDRERRVELERERRRP